MFVHIMIHRKAGGITVIYAINLSDIAPLPLGRLALNNVTPLLAISLLSEHQMIPNCIGIDVFCAVSTRDKHYHQPTSFSSHILRASCNFSFRY
jgi:hypothetical protein